MKIIYKLKHICICKNFHIADPVSLFGEGLYNLNSVKYISVTDSFKGLDRNIKKCQSIETIENCKTRLYIETMRQKCGCLPISLRLSDQVR